MSSQDITLYEQFNGKYDFTFFGNTMNTQENNTIFSPVTVTSSSATMNLNPTDVIEKAYLYWAGSGDGDFNVTLNTTTITPDRTFTYSILLNEFVFTYFSAFKDVTALVQSTGNGTYTLSDLDISAFEELHLQRRTNFAGWAIVIVYKNDALPLNQINVYDGLQGVPNELSITLDNLNVIDNLNSKVGFLAWEGDSLLSTEQFRINGDLLSNAQNPSSNVFNGSNSFTGSTTLYNMDLDVYDIQDHIAVGDTSAEISLTSTQDFVMINTVVTKLNSQIPDGTVIIDSVNKQCDSRTIVVNYTVSNLNCTGPLPEQTPVSIYINGQLIDVIETLVAIPVDGSVSLQTTIVLPDTIPDNFNINFVVDDKGDGTGVVNELIETNNSFTVSEALGTSPTFNPLENLLSCNEGFTQGTFNFSSYEALVKTDPEDSAAFYETLEDANNGINPILDTSNYVAVTTPKEIFIRLDNANCYATTSFMLTTRNCPPTVYNFISANNDNRNDHFTIAGLQNIFLNYKIEIYNRWGKLVWTGSQQTEKWDGYIKEGMGTKNAPDGTYFYLLYLNDPDYPQPLSGYLYLVH
ncbi:gliding motility-associated C-terminal domain-containing protein [Flavobacterium terrisoli]|uniref:gliding motility-associated C-terminal domain-containing protein n=1 Tax=Flavobacterium terrisoli TaxID=3242195 RepID=UPI002542B1E2|nr:gliding motility-associated C-terminal domain-containing protein [Flavobacterium buctense]